jgi:hypothetical protein
VVALRDNGANALLSAAIGLSATVLQVALVGRTGSWHPESRPEGLGLPPIREMLAQQPLQFAIGVSLEGPIAPEELSPEALSVEPPPSVPPACRSSKAKLSFSSAAASVCQALVYDIPARAAALLSDLSDRT